MLYHLQLAPGKDDVATQESFSLNVKTSIAERLTTQTTCEKYSKKKKKT